MSLDFVMEHVVKPLSCFVYSRGKGCVSYIRSYDDNIASLKEELQNLHLVKKELKSKVSNGQKNLETITATAEIWLNKVSILSQNEELKKIVVCEEKIAEKVVMLMEEKDLMKVLREGDEMMIGVVIKVMMELHDEHNNETDQEFKRSLKGVVLEVMEETIEKFKKMITEDIKVAMIMMTILKDEDVAKLSEGNKEMVDMLEKGRKMLEEESSEIHDSDESNTKDVVGSLVRPFETLVRNDNFMNMELPENMKLGVKMMDDLWKGRSAGLKDENVIEKHKDKDHRHHCCYYFKHFLNRYEMSKSAEKMVNYIKSIISETPTSVTSPRNIEDMETIPSGFVVGMESREQCLQVILTKLLDDQVNCVGVYGMGGIGKTTLVKEVQSKAKANFDTITMAAISEFQNIERIQDQLAEGMGLSLGNVRISTERATKLYNMLLQKKSDQGGMKRKRKILIILDNMWEKVNLSEVGIPFVCTNEFCCKILVTSRDRIVCEMMGIKDDDIIELGLLSVNESKKLFQHHVNKTIDEGDYKLVAQKLLEKCNRLPLNIMTTANMLKEKNLSTWQRFVCELEKPTSTEVSRMHRETYKILETSYKFIESEEKKTFFLLACLSPLDSSISVDDLMRYGVGLDLFQNVDKLSEALEQASKWARELVSSSLLLKDDGSELIYLKIHDDVRASAILFAEKDEQRHKFLVNAVPGWMSKERLNKYTAISLLSGGHDFSRLNAVKAELLQILLLKGMRSDTSELDDGFFQGMPNLKVLHLSCMNLKPRLPKSIVELKNLKTLQLELCKLGDISLMCMLTELVVVSLRYSSLEELPAEMVKLVNLRILDLGGCRFKSHTNTKVIARLSSLEGLYLFDKFHECATDHEFNELTHLNLLEVGYRLDLNNYNLIHLPLSRFFEHLDRFCIVFTREEYCVDSFSGEHRALQFQGLCLDWEFEESEESDFRSAHLLDIQALKDSSSIEALIKRTEYLTFDSSKLKKNLVPEYDKDGFRDLKHLEVSRCEGMECVINTDIDGSNNLIAFQNLECLELVELDDLKMICKGQCSRMFSNLRRLYLRDLSHLEYALPLALLPKNLTEIRIWNCSRMKFIFNDNDYCLPSDVSEHNENNVIDLPLLKLLSIGLSDLVSLVGPVTKADAFFSTKINCPSLELLNVRLCHKIKNVLWSKEHDISGFRNLKKIKIYDFMGLQSLASASVFCALVQLEKLTISLSSGLQEIITEETEEQKTIEFRQLRELDLDRLDSLKSFYGGSNRVKFPKLKSLNMYKIPKLIAFVGSEDPSTTLFSDKVEFPCLEWMEVNDVMKDADEDRDVKDEVAGGLEMLEELEIKSCKKLDVVIRNVEEEGGDNDRVVMFPRLKTLKLSKLNIRSFSTRSYSTLHFSSLEWLKICDCNKLETFWSGPGPFTAPKLKQLDISNCQNMKWFLSGELTQVVELLSLQQVKIERAYCMKSFSATPLKAPKLREVSISYCRDMEWILPGYPNHDDVLDLPSLEILHIKRSKLQTFSTEPLKAPKLTHIRINNRDFDKGELRFEQFLEGYKPKSEVKRVESLPFSFSTPLSFPTPFSLDSSSKNVSTRVKRKSKKACARKKLMNKSNKMDQGEEGGNDPTGQQ